MVDNHAYTPRVGSLEAEPPMKIMIVDDSSAMRMIVKKTLRQAGFGGHEITEADDGAKALAAIQVSKPDLVLSDWNMPNMTGLQLLEALRDSGVKLPFGFVTTEATPDMRVRAFEAGAKFLISKPFTPESFKDQLGPHIR
jgi:two-component system chemotaxis response regulator CheY